VLEGAEATEVEAAAGLLRVVAITLV
jgi:hypothetical protein